jgi:hypothetical protein
MRAEEPATQLQQRKSYDSKFDELAKELAPSVMRRGALKKFGVGTAGIALALGPASKAEAGEGWPAGHRCTKSSQCASGNRLVLGQDKWAVVARDVRS